MAGRVWAAPGRGKEAGPYGHAQGCALAHQTEGQAAEEWRYRLSRPKLRAGRPVIQLFNRGEDGVTPVLRHPASSTNVLVRITAITVPTQGEMFADPEGMARARSNLSFQKLSEVFAEQLDPEAIKARHGLQLPERDEDTDEG